MTETAHVIAEIVSKIKKNNITDPIAIRLQSNRYMDEIFKTGLTTGRRATYNGVILSLCGNFNKSESSDDIYRHIRENGGIINLYKRHVREKQESIQEEMTLPIPRNRPIFDVYAKDVIRSEQIEANEYAMDIKRIDANFFDIPYAQRHHDDNEKKRALNRVYKMAENFEYRISELPTVVERNGRYIVIDGVHRILTMYRIGFDNIPCRVIRINSEIEIAKLVKDMNINRRRLSRVAQYRAELQQGDIWAVRLNKIITEANASIADSRSPGAIRGVHEIYEFMKNFDDRFDVERSLINGIALYRKCWPQEQIHTNLAIGMSLFFGLYQTDGDMSDLILPVYTKPSLMFTVARQNSQRYGQYRSIAVAQLMIDLYNRNKRKSKRLPDVDRVI
ncbi:MAG: DUF6551 family protein [Candidimonas sp.]